MQLEVRGKTLVNVYAQVNMIMMAVQIAAKACWCTIVD
jgi:hypothetical protein